MTHATSKIIWLLNLLDTLQVPCTNPIILHSDNQTAIHLATNYVFHEKIKHVDVDCHFIKNTYSGRDHHYKSYTNSTTTS